MRVAITGATGFLGAHLTRRLLRDGHRVAVLRRRESDPWRLGEDAGRVEEGLADLRDPAGAAEFFRRFAPDVVYHLAWEGGSRYERQQDPDQILVNLPAAVRMIRDAALGGARRFVGLGTSVEYGTYEVPVRESQPANPTTLYGTAKHLAGAAVLALGSRVDVEAAWIRLFWAYGPMDEPARLLPAVTLSLLKGERPRLSEGRQLWDYLYVDDAVDALARVGRPGAPQGVFNLGSGRPVAIRDLVERIRARIDPGLELGFGDLPYREGQCMHLEADTARLRKATGWVPQTGLDEGLDRTVEWFRRHRSRYGG